MYLRETVLRIGVFFELPILKNDIKEQKLVWVWIKNNVHYIDDGNIYLYLAVVARCSIMAFMVNSRKNQLEESAESFADPP